MPVCVNLARRVGNLKLPANLDGRWMLDLAVARDTRTLPILFVDEDGMAASFPQQSAPVLLEVANQVGPLHADTVIFSRMMRCPGVTRFPVSSRIVSSMS